MPARRQRARFGLAVADHAEDEELRIVEGRAERVRERVTELAPFVNAAGRLGRHVAGDAARERELPEEQAHPDLVARHVRIKLAVRAFEPRVGDDPRTAMAGTAHEDRLEVPLLDDAVGVRVKEVQARRRTPVAEQAWLDVLEAQRLAQERVGEQVDLPHGQVVRRAPCRVESAVYLGAQRLVHRSPPGSAFTKGLRARVRLRKGALASTRGR